MKEVDAVNLLIDWIMENEVFDAEHKLGILNSLRNDIEDEMEGDDS